MMIVYRICLPKWANSLTASGNPARWNTKGNFVIYTAGSRALACLENVVHRSGEILDQSFKVMLIEFPDNLPIKEITHNELPIDWHEFTQYSDCQKIGDQWLKDKETAILKVPSAIIQKEFNFLFNPNHKDFRFVELTRVEDFEFDPRIKNS